MSRLLRAILISPTFPNTGSVARDHLANERTFLAWLRTGLGFVALGIAIERFSRLEMAQPYPRSYATFSSDGGVSKSEDRESGGDGGPGMVSDMSNKEEEQTLVVTLLGTGGACISYGTVRYFSTLKLLQSGVYKPAFLGAGILACGVAGFAGAGAGVVWRGEMNRAREEGGAD